MTLDSIRHINVPYYSQWGSPDWVRPIVEESADPCDDPHWRQSGFADPERYRFWAQRVCGLTCLESVLDFWRIRRASRAALLDQALERGAYKMRTDGGVDGLIYRPFADWVGEAFGLKVHVLPEIGIEALAGHIDSDTFAIASVSPRIRYPDEPNETRGGHLILLHGADRDGVWFHNPSGIAPHQADAYLRFDAFERFFAGRGMTISRSHGERSFNR
ncbi:hypothetical protein FAZ95_32675 [Trinickia violacea]|uniref:Peptidase C39-like domain-containing protein n=1 Tax=Trinickia violacea TaxID=2571746 RepID=A0A4P8IZ66_9BURK|nr:C39 family peptidase [Trinickia violacea]QCP53766.1 hypothetical protein FAZ95_32675 [Trinickia violacea]